MERTVMHIDLDTFFVSVERLKNSKLFGIPVIIGGISDRGVVAGCSYEARYFGVRSGMPMRMARLMCADAQIIRGDMDSYIYYSDMVTDIIASHAPVYEKASIDEHYLDLTGMDRFFGCKKWAHELRMRITNESGLPISLGLSVNKTVSKIATGEAKPAGEREVPRALVQPFMDPLPIKKIPMLGPKTCMLLRSMGVADIATLRSVPPEMMEQVLGKNGRTIWEKANGIDFTPVENYSVQKSIGSETTFNTDTTDVTMLNDLISAIVEKLCFELRAKQKLTSCVVVKIKYANFDTHTLQCRVPYTSLDHQLTSVAKSLFQRLYNRRMLIRLLGVRFSHLVSGTQQLNLFDDTPEQINLYKAMDTIRKRYGNTAVHKASNLGLRNRM